jgi:hypothetical protein
MIGVKLESLIVVRNRLIVAILLQIGVAPKPIGLRHLPDVPPAFLNDRAATRNDLRGCLRLAIRPIIGACRRHAHHVSTCNDRKNRLATDSP